MSVIVLRGTKGSPLTNAEMDLNLAHLNSDKSERASNLADLTNIGEAKTNLGLNLVTNTADADKPVSTAAAAVLALKAPLASPDFSGTPSKLGVALATVNDLATALTASEVSTDTAIATERTAERIAAATLTNKTLTNPVINGFTGTARQKSVNSIGYDVGSGGAVVQATSKATAVTLDKPAGQITLNGAALAAAAVVGFNCANSACTLLDTVYANIQANGTTTEDAYLLQAFPAAGSIYFSLRNLSGGSLSEALVINFSIIKGSAS